jgi:hypothetical protein
VLLAIEDIETSAAREAEQEKKPSIEPPADSPTQQKKKRRNNRGALPARFPQIHQTIEPDSTVCLCCNGGMHVIQSAPR